MGRARTSLGVVAALVVVVTACTDNGKSSSSVQPTSVSVTTTDPATTDTATPASLTSTQPTTTASTTTPSSVTASTTTASTAAAALPPPDGDAFYLPPSPLPGSKAGDLIWYAPATNGPDDMTSYKMLYRSESVDGDAIAVSGVVVFDPAVVGPDAPILSFGHGTTGLGDQCAPSRLGGTFADSGYVTVAKEQGFVYVATDYEGLGTPGDHPYLMGQSEGRGILDAARAAKQIPGVPIGDASKVIIAGHSQGGEAALSAAELAAAYAPELDVRGVVGIAPPGELGLVVRALTTGPLNGFLPMILSGARAVDPDLDMSVAAGPDALAVVDDVTSMCGNAIFERAAGLDAATTGFTDPATDATWAALLLANSPGHVPSKVPVLIVHGDADTTVPPALSLLIEQAGCALGQTIQRNVYPGANHISVLTASHDDAVAWMDDRLTATTPAPSNCA